MRRFVVLAIAATFVLGWGLRVGAHVPFSLHVPVLMYHHIACKPPAAPPGDTLWVCPDTFRAQLQRLKDEGWTTITGDRLARHLEAHQRVGHKRFMVSVDDGYDDAFVGAFPVLQALGMAATFYVITGKTGTSGYATWDQWRSMRGSGMDVANHTVDHLHLDRLTPEHQASEIEGAQTAITTEIGHRPLTIAYPFGDNDHATRRAAKAAGLVLGFTIVAGGGQSIGSPLLSPRLYTQETDTPDAVLWVLTPYA